MKGIIVILLIIPACICMLHVIGFINGRKVVNTNVLINEDIMRQRVQRKKKVGTDMRKQKRLIRNYLKSRFPDMYYYSLKNCRVYSSVVTAEVLIEDKEPKIVSFELRDIISSKNTNIMEWIENKAGKIEELKTIALSEEKVFFIIPWDEYLAEEKIRKKIISWYEEHTLYRITVKDNGIVFNFQDEMF